MKKLSVLLALFMLTALTMPAKAITITEREMGYISVNTSASKELAPDTATVSFAVETMAKTSKAAADKNKEITANLISNLKPLIEIDKKDTIQTKNLNLYPNYTYEKNNKKTLVGYTMVNTVTVKTKKLAVVPKLIDTAIANNATNVSELKFFVEDENNHVAQLVQEATTKAKVISRLTADSLGQKVSGLKTINVNWGPSYESYDNVRLYNSTKASPAAGGVSTPVEPGKVKLQANVHAQFYVK